MPNHSQIVDIPIDVDWWIGITHIERAYILHRIELGKDKMYDSNVQYNVVHPYIHCIDDSLTNMGIVPLPEKNRIHPLDREFKKLIRNKLKLFISSSK